MSDDEAIELLHQFIDYSIFNGAPGAGQALYNDAGNPWLHERVEQFVSRRVAEAYFDRLEQMAGSDEKFVRLIRRARSDYISRELVEARQSKEPE
jgi:hypothetical protein